MEIQEQLLKKIQSIQLEMAEVLLNFCKQHGLTIWAGYGTLLGAVRHQGFIPWDDDMDFVMLRGDFDKLRRLTTTETLPHPLTFDGSRVDVIKVKNIETTQIAISKISANENYGIWVDIWCLDSFPREGISAKSYNLIRNQLRVVSNSMQMSFAHAEGVASVLYHTYSLLYTCFVGNERIYNNVEDNIKRTGGGGMNGEMLVNILLYSRIKNNTSYKQLKKYELSWFNKTVYLPFEGRELPCPAEYDKVLTAEYGDYMTPVRGGAVHGTVILDVDRPYKDIIFEYLNSIPWYKRILYKL